MTLHDLIMDSHERALRKGWWVDREPNIAEKLALIHSEVSEALEAYRDGDMGTSISEKGKPEGFEVELADIVIRVADLCGFLDIDLDAVIQLKAKYNEGRPYRHGGKKA